MSSVKVAVRVRPFNTREKDRKAKLIIQMKGKTTEIVAPLTGKKNTFNFDFSHWTHDPKDETFIDQEKCYQDIGLDMLGAAYEGYNCCIFAYGQTGSGKSYTMMGAEGAPGVIPRVCAELFRRIDSNTDKAMSYAVEVGYFEIYNEKVRDLLNPKQTGNLRVREHPSLGPYVEGLTKLMVHNHKEIENLMEEGNKTRTVASTAMNSESSRSHAVFTMVFTQTESVNASLSSDKVSKISLVDLAGSERANSTGATGARLKEGANINKSLTTLGKVIAALAKASGKAPSTGKGKKGAKEDNFVPYRDSVLTWLLRENLGGNSRTCMVAALSPADINYDETLSTLRYADSAKQIVCKAIVNEDPNAKIIRELREEIKRLTQMINVGGVSPQKEPTSPRNGESASEQLAESERLMSELSESKEQKEQRTREVQEEREAALKQMGIALKSDGGHLGVTQQKQPHLLNLNEDPLMSELLLYYLSLEGVTRVGQGDDDFEPDIKLSGEFITKKHATFQITDDKVVLTPLDGDTFVNGDKITEPTQVSGGCRIIFGQVHVFRFVNPKEAQQRASGGGKFDWAAAQRELVKQQALDDLKVDTDKHKETQARLGELESKMLEEKEAADRLLQAQREEFENRMKLIEEKNTQNSAEEEETKLQLTPFERSAVVKAFLHWRKYRHMSLRTGLVAATPLIKEANAICTELNKNVMFQFVCRTGGVYFPGETPETQVMVELTNRTTQDRIAIWPLSKLNDRIYDMREFYHSNMSDKKLADPFSDRPPWFRVLGRAFMSLKSLLYEIPVEHTLFVVDEASNVVGSVRVSIVPGLGTKTPTGEEDAVQGNIFEEQHISFAGVALDESAETMQATMDEQESTETPTTSDTSDTSNVRTAMHQRLRDRHGQKYHFVVNVISASNIPTEYVDVFCQFRFQMHGDAAFSTESLQNTTGELPFHHAQQMSVDVGNDFFEYADRGHLVFEMFGHYDNSVHDALEPAPTIAPTIAKAPTINNDFEAQHDLLVWFEVCELVPSGEYAPVEVQQEKGVRYYQMQQGVQRRVRVIVSHESGADLEWERVLDLAIGNVRPTFQQPRDIQPTPALPLVILPGLSTQTVGDDRTFLHLEANWDSSRHNSILLNRVTPLSEFVFVTLSCVIDVKGCKRPAVIRENLCMRIQARDTRSKGGFFKGFMSTKVTDSDKISHVYEMQLKTAGQEGASRSTSGTPTNLSHTSRGVQGWRPRGFSLLSDHRVLLERLTKIQQVEATKQHLDLTKAKAISFSGQFESDDVAVSKPAVVGDELLTKVVALLGSGVSHSRAPSTEPLDEGDLLTFPPTKKEEVQIHLFPEIKKVFPYENITHKGYLLFLETRFAGWVKRWAFIRKPYLFVTDHEKDPVIRVVIRLSDITIQFNEDQGMMMGIKHLFTMCTKHRGFLVQTLKPRDMEVWLQHFDPLLAGSIMSRMGYNPPNQKRSR
eukprot:m.33711 g.33711  ORF g.33711 m.33711 type:complete len:1456 (-) comp16859_c1_seq1:91-4458(-)